MITAETLFSMLPSANTLFSMMVGVIVVLMVLNVSAAISLFLPENRRGPNPYRVPTRDSGHRH